MRAIVALPVPYLIPRLAPPARQGSRRFQPGWRGTSRPPAGSADGAADGESARFPPHVRLFTRAGRCYYVGIRPPSGNPPSARFRSVDSGPRTARACVAGAWHALRRRAGARARRHGDRLPRDGPAPEARRRDQAPAARARVPSRHPLRASCARRRPRRSSVIRTSSRSTASTRWRTSCSS